MNKRQTVIYNWLVNKPGYLKKSADKIPNMTNKVVDNATWIKDCKVALKQARLDNPLIYGNYRNVLDKQQDILIGGKIVKKSLSEIFPWIGNGSNKDRLEYIRKQNIAKFGTEYHPKDVAFKKSVDKFRNTPGTYYITGCAHAPWHNQAMYDATFKYLQTEVDLQGLILAGDILDMNSLSSHDRGKVPVKGVTLDWEYHEANKLMDQFDDIIVAGTKDYIWGNHEDRYNRIVKDSDIAKFGSSLISPDVALNLKGRGYNVYKDWKNDAIHLGKHIDICHGEFYNVHSAKKTIDTYRKSTLYFHTHRFQIFVEGLVGGFNMGFGGDINAPVFNYATRAMKNSWINSSCLVTIDIDGFYHVEPLIFINQKLIVSGKAY